MTINAELAGAARWISAVPSLSDPERVEWWERLIDSLDEVRPPADGVKQLVLIHWREDVERELATRSPSAPLHYGRTDDD